MNKKIELNTKKYIDISTYQINKAIEKKQLLATVMDTIK